MKIPTIAALLLVVASVACAPVSQEGAEIQARSAGWSEALNAGDIDALVALYTDDARLMPPNGPAAQGSDAVRADFGELIAAGLQGELKTIETRVAGDIGYRVGTYTLSAPDGSQADKGKYIEVWRMVDGEWKISNDTWNSDLPTGAGLTRAVFIHEVEDFAHWHAAWTGENSRHGVFAEHGAPEVTVYQNPESPNHVALEVGIENAEVFHAFLQSPEGAAAKAEDGVKDRGMQVFMKVE